MIRPILNQNCVGCHGGVRQKGGTSFISRLKLMRPSCEPASPPAIVAACLSKPAATIATNRVATEVIVARSRESSTVMSQLISLEVASIRAWRGKYRPIIASAGANRIIRRALSSTTQQHPRRHRSRASQTQNSSHQDLGAQAPSLKTTESSQIANEKVDFCFLTTSQEKDEGLMSALAILQQSNCIRATSAFHRTRWARAARMGRLRGWLET